ncbi:unnamed protein product, partial [Ectocarpus sp. 12 AP-2014]
MTTALVTGATAGIGWAVVERLCADGFDVVAVGRRDERLRDLAAKTGCTTQQGDVTDTLRMQTIVGAAKPTVLINNAGIGLAITGLETASPEDVAKAVAVNISAPIQLTRLALPHMRQAGHGHIVNIGSIAGLHTLVSALYGAGKAAVHRFTQNLRYELVGTGIRVSEICPGRVESEFYDSGTGNIE